MGCGGGCGVGVGAGWWVRVALVAGACQSSGVLQGTTPPHLAGAIQLAHGIVRRVVQLAGGVVSRLLQPIARLEAQGLRGWGGVKGLAGGVGRAHQRTALVGRKGGLGAAPGCRACHVDESAAPGVGMAQVAARRAARWGPTPLGRHLWHDAASGAQGPAGRAHACSTRVACSSTQLEEAPRRYVATSVAWRSATQPRPPRGVAQQVHRVSSAAKAHRHPRGRGTEPWRGDRSGFRGGEGRTASDRPGGACTFVLWGMSPTREEPGGRRQLGGHPRCQRLPRELACRQSTSLYCQPPHKVRRRQASWSRCDPVLPAKSAGPGEAQRPEAGAWLIDQASKPAVATA